VGPRRRCAQGPTTQNCSALQRIATQSLPPARLDCPCEPMSPCRRVPSGARRRAAPRTPARVRARNASHTTTCCVDFRRRAVAEWRTAAYRTRPRARGGCRELCGQACIGVGLAHERAVPVRWRCHAWQEGARRPTKLYGAAEVRPSSSDAEQRQTKAAWATEQARAVEEVRRLELLDEYSGTASAVSARAALPLSRVYADCGAT
jgi:hypothetical protein